jgi:hypothetical protein
MGFYAVSMLGSLLAKLSTQHDNKNTDEAFDEIAENGEHGSKG